MERALEGRITDHHRFLLRLLWKELGSLEEMMAELQVKIEEKTQPHRTQISQLDQVPGVDCTVGEVVLAEIGTRVDPFPSSQQLSSWTGLSPGNEESAGKRRTGRTTKGNRWLRQALVQAAWAASHSKNSYLAAPYQRLAARRGKKRATVAVAHSILVIIYYMLKTGGDYSDLGRDFFDQLNHARLTHYYRRRLEDLGHQVTLKPVTT